MSEVLYCKDGAYLNYSKKWFPIYKDGRWLKEGRWIDIKDKWAYIKWLEENWFTWLEE